MAPDLVHTWRFAAGAAFALLRRVEVGSSDEATSLEESAFLPRTATLLVKIRLGALVEPEWLAGFWYNAAIMRIDALYERLFRAMTQNSDPRARAMDLYTQARDMFPDVLARTIGLKYNTTLWKKVREEVNALKHFVAGADSSLRMNTERTLSALEHLLAFLAEPNPRERLVSLYSTGTVRVAKR